MKKLFIGIIVFILGVITTLFILQGWNWFPEDSTFDFPTFLLSLSVFAGLGGVFWSTKKQIIKQTENVKKQIDNQNNNIKVQIENQNRESHKPYITVENVKKIEDTYNFSNMVDFINISHISQLDEIDSGKFIQENIEYIDYKDIIVEIHETDEENIYNYEFKFKLLLRNIGYGIAHNIYPIAIDGYVALLENPTIDDSDYFSTIDIGANCTYQLKLKTEMQFESSEQIKDLNSILLFHSFEFMLFYSDLNSNVYSSIINISCLFNQITNCGIYTEGTSEYEHCLSYKNINKNDLKNNYKLIVSAKNK